jgi:hypothetical protein
MRSIGLEFQQEFSRPKIPLSKEHQEMLMKIIFKNSDPISYNDK